MKTHYLVLLLTIPVLIHPHNGPHHDHDRNKLILGAVAAGCVIAKPSMLLLPFKVLLLPFKLLAMLGTVALFIVPAALAAGVWLSYPYWKHHKKELMEHWDKHKHLITSHVNALTKRGKHAWHTYNKSISRQSSARPDLPTDIRFLPNYRA